MLSTLLNSYDFKRAMVKQQLDQQLRFVSEQEQYCNYNDDDDDGHSVPGLYSVWRQEQLVYFPIQESHTILEMLKAYPELAATKFAICPSDFCPYGYRALSEQIPPWKLPQALPLFHLLNIHRLQVEVLKEVYEMYPPAIFSKYTEVQQEGNEYSCSPLFCALLNVRSLDVFSFLVSMNPKAVSEPNSVGELPIRNVVCVGEEEQLTVLKMLLDVAPVGIFETDRDLNSLFSDAIQYRYDEFNPNGLDLLAEKLPMGVHNAVLSERPPMQDRERNRLVNFFERLDSDQKINLCFRQYEINPCLCSAVAAMNDSVVSLNLDTCFMRRMRVVDGAGPDWSSCPVEKVTLSPCKLPPCALQWLLHGFSTMPNLRELHLYTKQPNPQVFSEVLEAFVRQALNQMSLRFLEIRGFVMEQKRLVETLSSPEHTSNCIIVFQGQNKPEPVLAISYYSAMNYYARGISNWTTKSLLIDGLLAIQADQRVLGPFKFPLLFGLMRETPSLWA